MNLPQTAFSLLCNATNVSAFRREAHEDLRVSFQRFGVVDGAIQDACTRMENAAYELRVHTIDPSGQSVNPPARRAYLAARQDLATATQDLFRALTTEFTWFFTGYSRHAVNSRYRAALRFQLEAWKKSPALLLDLTYQCLYVPEFAANVVDAWQALQNDPRVRRVRAVSGTNALFTIAQALAAHTDLATASATEHAQALCDALAQEYTEAGWIHCW